MKKERALLSATKLKEACRRDKERKAKSRARTKEAAELEKQSSQHEISPQSLGKAVQRAKKCLPQNPRKRSKVLRKLAQSYKVDIDETVADHRGKSHMVPAEAIAACAFYVQDDVFWQSPNRKDAIRQKDA